MRPILDPWAGKSPRHRNRHERGGDAAGARALHPANELEADATALHPSPVDRLRLTQPVTNFLAALLPIYSAFLPDYSALRACRLPSVVDPKSLPEDHCHFGAYATNPGKEHTLNPESYSPRRARSHKKIHCGERSHVFYFDLTHMVMLPKNVTLFNMPSFHAFHDAFHEYCYYGKTVLTITTTQQMTAVQYWASLVLSTINIFLKSIIDCM